MNFSLYVNMAGYCSDGYIWRIFKRYWQMYTLDKSEPIMLSFLPIIPYPKLIHVNTLFLIFLFPSRHLLSLGTLVPNRKDWHEKMAT